VRSRTKKEAHRRLAAFTCLSLTLAALLCQGCGSSSGPSSWIGEGTIAHASYVDGDERIFIVDRDGENIVVLPQGCDRQFHLDWGPSEWPFDDRGSETTTSP